MASNNSNFGINSFNENNTEQITYFGAIKLTFIFILLLWGIEIVDLFINIFSLNIFSLDKFGIYPRKLFSIFKIPIASFLHGSFLHLLGNTFPLLVLTPLVIISKPKRAINITIFIIMVSGLGAWFFGSSNYHLGASGIVFGYVGLLLFQFFFSRKLSHFFIALLVGILFGLSILISIIPKAGVSWSMHWWGFGAGVISAFIFRSPLEKKLINI